MVWASLVSSFHKVKAWEILSPAWRCDIVTNRQTEAGQCPKKNFEALFVIFCPGTWERTVSVHLVEFSWLKTDICKLCGLQCLDTAPLRSTLMSIWHHRTWLNFPGFASPFCMCKHSITGTREGLGTRASSEQCSMPTHNVVCTTLQTISVSQACSGTWALLRGAMDMLLLCLWAGTPAIQFQWPPCLGDVSLPHII